MNNQASDGITDAGKDLVLSCIKSQELRDHMHKYLYWPAPIIAGSLKTLDEKRAMLEQLREEVASELTEDIDSHLAQLNSALDMLNNVERDRGILLLYVMFYNEEERDADALDGPFPTASWDAAQTLMKRYIEEYPDDDWSESYWKINLYTSEDLHEHQTAQPSLSLAATKDGELIFLRDLRNHRTRKSHVESVWRNDSRRFCANNEPIYTPWVPGDIIKIDGRPFDHGPRFAIVLENDYEHTLRGQIWCAGPSKYHGVKEGSLSSGTYSDSLLDPFIPSALYTAERYTGDLPDDCAFMLELSQKLHDDPDYGKQWSEGSVGHDCLQPYRKPANQSELDIRPDIFEFLDSRSIKEHLQRINYELTTPVAAFIVDRSHKATLQQKLEGWQKIIDTMPNCAMSRRNDTFNIPDFHAFLRNVIRQEQRKLAHFKRTDGQSLYFFEDYSWDRRDRCDLLYGPYSSYQKCFDAIWKELDGDDPKAIKITRRPIDPDEDHYADDMVLLNANGEVMSCDYRFEGEWDEAGTASDFEDMWFDIPTPSMPETSSATSNAPTSRWCCLTCKLGDPNESTKSLLPPSTKSASFKRPTSYCAGTDMTATPATCTPTGAKSHPPRISPSTLGSLRAFFWTLTITARRSSQRSESSTASGRMSKATWRLIHSPRWPAHTSYKHWRRKRCVASRTQTVGSRTAIQSCSIRRPIPS